VNWVEYTLTEKGMKIYLESKSLCSTYITFSERLRHGIVTNNLSKRDYNILSSIIDNTNRLYCLPMDVIEKIAGNFYGDRGWVKYIKAIRLMEDVRWSLPNKKYEIF
jgi:hypothetical protein